VGNTVFEETLVGKIEQDEFMLSGHNACPGCGAALTVRLMMKALKDRAVIVIPASCWSIISGVNPLRCLETVVLHCPFPAASCTVIAGRKTVSPLPSVTTSCSCSHSNARSISRVISLT